MHTAWKHIHRCTDTSARIAGRIHRLGQSKEVLVKRFCFRDRCAPLPAHTPLLLRRFRERYLTEICWHGSLEENITILHKQLNVGTASLTDGKISGKTFQMLTSS